MRLIDADRVKAALAIFNDRENGNEHFLFGIETAGEIIDDAETADAVSIPQAARFLASYAIPPESIISVKLESRVAAWEELLRGIAKGAIQYDDRPRD